MKKTSEIYKNFIMMLEANAHTENAIDQFYDKVYKEGFEAGKEYMKGLYFSENKVFYTRVT